MATRQPHVGKPLLLHQLIEPRALLEMAALPWSLPLLAGAPRGDGHPVLLLPGFMADEGTLVVLKLFLREPRLRSRDLGLRAQRRLQQPGTRRRCEQKIRYMHHKSGRKVSLVGWSLGGMFAMYGAHEAPECIRSVITLGSPVSFDPRRQPVAAAGEGALPADRPPDGDGGARDAPARQEAAPSRRRCRCRSPASTR